MRRLRLALLCLLAAAPALAVTALAVMSGYGPPPGAASDPDYTAGLAALEAADWPGVTAHLEKVVERRPWDDHAHTLMGYAYRKQGDYDRALEHYRQALELNPYHRGALAYLGEAYLELDRPAEARALLDRLEAECRRLAENDWKAGCEEWQTLDQALDAYRGRAAPNPATP